MRSTVFISGLILISISVAPSCVSELDPDATLGLLEDEGFEEPDQDPLSDDHTHYEIDNPYEHEPWRQNVPLHDDALYAGEEDWIVAYRAVSGAVRGRVLRRRR